MSNYNYNQDNNSYHNTSNNNPYQNPSQNQYAPPAGPPPSQQYQQQQQYQSSAPHYAGQNTNYPPYNNSAPGQGTGPGAPPRRTGTFNEETFVPASERGEQREAIEQFELNRRGPEDSTDRDVAKLQQEFPSVDGSLIAALYSDAQNMGATREMLRELASSK